MQRWLFFDLFLLPFSLMVWFMAGVAALAAHVSPVNGWWIALSAPFFPFLFMLNLVFTGYWIYRKKWLFVIMHGLVLVPGLKTFGAQWAGRCSAGMEQDQAQFSVLSFNVRNFDFYNWKGNYLGTSTIRQDILNLIAEVKPDILCFQEFFHSDTGKYRIMHYLSDTLGYTEHFTVLPIRLYECFNFGMAIYSRYPIINSRQLPMPQSAGRRRTRHLNLCLYADIRVGDDTVRVYNIHFQSYRFGRQEYELVTEGLQVNREKNSKAISSLMRKMKQAQGLRALQVERVREHMEKSPYPIILCTDLNDTPSSWSYWHLRKNLKDAFLEKGCGLGITYAGPFPALRIDYILHSHSLTSSHFQIIRRPLSDHYPLYVRFNLPVNR
jgi:endonuclease/exonuclease/phosphatase family metal-dependent hydrolase